MKKIIALIVSMFMLVFSLSAMADGFTDMPAADSPSYAAFDYAIKNKIISGTNGKIMPDNPITKAEAAAFIMRSGKLQASAGDMSLVKDVPNTLWYYESMSKALGAKIISIDENGCLYPTLNLTRRAAWDMLYKAFGQGKTYTAVANGSDNATRGDFILWLYDYIKPLVTEAPTNVLQNPTEAATDSVKLYSEMEVKAAQEAMQVALGIRADGSSYLDVPVYRDFDQTDWSTGRVDDSTPSYRPNNPSSGNGNGNGGNTDSDEEASTETETETDAPTETPTNSGSEQQPTEYPTDEPTEETTEAPTEPPTYNGNIDNENDNLQEDLWNDGWRPPGSTDNPDSGNGGGFDEEDDFIVDDLDTTEAPTDAPTETPTEETTEKETEAPTESESVTESETATEPESETSTEDETASDPEEDTTNETESTPEDDATNETESTPEDDATNETESTPEDDATSETESIPEDDATSETESNPDSDSSATEPSEEAGDVAPEEASSDTEPDEEHSGFVAWLFSKDWWFI